MSVLNIQSGLNSFNQSFAAWRKRENKQKEIHESNSMKTAIIEGYNVEMDSERNQLSDGSLVQEISHAESDVTMVQTAAAALQLQETQLAEIWDLLLSFSEQKVQTGPLWEAGQQQLKQLLDRFDRIAMQSSYGEKSLLDGSYDVHGVVNGEHLELVEVGDELPSSPVRGYSVRIEHLSTRAELNGRVPLSQQLIDLGEQFLLQEGSSRLRFTTRMGEDFKLTMYRLQQMILKHRLQIEVTTRDEGILCLRHKQYGSAYRFGAASRTPGVLSDQSGKLALAHPGRDVVGSIDGEVCTGNGQLLQAGEESLKLSGLKIRYSGEKEDSLPFVVGKVSIFQNSIRFGGGNLQSSIRRLTMHNMQSDSLGREVDNRSAFRSLAEISLRSPEHATDALKVIEKAIQEVASAREKMELFNRKHLKDHLYALKEEHEQRLSAEEFPEDEIRARRIAEWTRQQIITDTGRSTLAQAHQKPQTVLSLLK